MNTTWMPILGKVLNKKKTAPLATNIVPFDPRRGSLADQEMTLMRELINEIADVPGPIVEIGTLAGKTTTEIAILDQGRHQIVTVDNYCWNPWGMSVEQHSAVAGQMLRYLSATGVVQRLEIDKDAFYESYDGPAPSMVFLDALHTYEGTKKDILWAKSVGAKVICGHDYIKKFDGVMRIVDEHGGPKRRALSLWVLG